MLKTISTLLFLLIHIICLSQEESIEIELGKGEEGTIIYFNDELIESNKAKFPNGEKGLLEFYIKNTKYKILSLDKISTSEANNKTIFFSLIIEEDGSIYKLQISYYPSKKHKKELQRLIKLMPKWKPAKVDGQNVKVRLIYELIIDIPSVNRKMKN